MDTKKLVTHALAAALGIAVGSKGSSGAAAARPSTSMSPDPIAATTPLHDPDDARALAELEKLHELRWLARAATLAEKERVLLERVVATIDRDERQAVALLACAGGGDGPLERDVAVKLQAATRGAHGPELRCALLDFLVSRADRESIEPTLVELA